MLTAPRSKRRPQRADKLGADAIWLSPGYPGRHCEGCPRTYEALRTHNGAKTEADARPRRNFLLTNQRLSSHRKHRQNQPSLNRNAAEETEAVKAGAAETKGPPLQHVDEN